MIRKGDYVVDMTVVGDKPRHRLGQVVDIIGQRYYLRAAGGGLEWNATVGVLRKATEEEIRAAEAENRNERLQPK